MSKNANIFNSYTQTTVTTIDFSEKCGDFKEAVKIETNSELYDGQTELKYSLGIIRNKLKAAEITLSLEEMKTLYNELGKAIGVRDTGTTSEATETAKTDDVSGSESADTNPF